MKKYNSVFTVSLSIDHDKADASDLTPEDIVKAIKVVSKDIQSGTWQPWVDGPEHTEEN